ncbi:MAG TPA: hypothetical protein VFY64_07950 [Nitrososphaeraceae archaeon]|nr:hypothetical protein [Nitrososphaeraceae archaeon]
MTIMLLRAVLPSDLLAAKILISKSIATENSPDLIVVRGPAVFI